MTRHQSEAVRAILHDIQICDPDELMSLHGVEITPEHSVIDHTYNLTYRSVDNWLAVVDADTDEGFEKFHHHEEAY